MDPKYHALLDPVYLDYALEVERTSASSNGDISVQRQNYNDSWRRHEPPLPETLRHEDFTVIARDQGEIPIRCYYNDSPTTNPRLTVYLHGGGWVLGNLDSHDAICADISRNCASHVVAVDYRLAPENPFPTPLYDCIDAIKALLDTPEKYRLDYQSVVLSGDSAGANMAAASCLNGVLEPLRIDGLMMIYPGLGASDNLASFRENEFAPILPYQALKAFFLAYIGGDENNTTPLTSPLLAGDVSSIPPCYISAANHDPLRDDAIEFARKLETQAIPCIVSLEENLGHGYLRVRHHSDAAGEAFRNCCQAVLQMHERCFPTKISAG
ncbi:MAG: alpha/beta hydrolase [Gammaproteobacteria bacterium]|nr:alpha/beta hydrolase [Gammaproteobacteria bacterium]